MREKQRKKKRKLENCWKPTKSKSIEYVYSSFSFFRTMRYSNSVWLLSVERVVQLAKQHVRILFDFIFHWFQSTEIVYSIAKFDEYDMSENWIKINRNRTCKFANGLFLLRTIANAFGSSSSCSGHGLTWALTWIQDIGVTVISSDFFAFFHIS